MTRRRVARNAGNRLVATVSLLYATIPVVLKKALVCQLSEIEQEIVEQDRVYI